MRRMKKFIAAVTAAFALTGFPIVQTEAAELMLGTFFSSDKDTDMQCYISDDGIKMVHIDGFPTNDIKGRDFSCQYYKHSLYVCLVDNENGNTFKIYKYKDLKEWQEPKSYKVTDREKKFPNVWAPDLLINDDGSAYVYFARQKGYDSKKDERKFDIFVSKIADIENEKDTFLPAKKIVLPESSDNYIDAQVRKVNGEYYMVVKNETIFTNNENKSPLLLHSKYPDEGFTEVENWPLKYIKGYEGFSILTKDDKVYIYADNFSDYYDDLASFNGEPSSHLSGHTVWITDKGNIEQGPYKASYVESSRRLRHGSVILIDDYAKENLKIDESILKSASENKAVKDNSDTDNKETNTVEEKPHILSLKKEYFDDSKSKDKDIIIENFAPALGVQYGIPNRKKVIIKNIVNPYGVEKIEINLTDGSSLEINGFTIFKNPDSHEDQKTTIYIDPNGKCIKWVDHNNTSFEKRASDEAKEAKE